MQKTANGASAKRTREIRVVGTNLAGFAIGQDNPAARHPDSVVALVRGMKAEGMTEAAIARATGVRPCTVGRWLRGERRATPPVRYIVRTVRVKQVTAADSKSAGYPNESSTCGELRSSLRDDDAELLEHLQKAGLI